MGLGRCPGDGGGAMRVVVSAAGRFHSIHLAHQVRRFGALHRFFSAGYAQADRRAVPEMLVTSNNWVNIADRVYIKLGLDRFMTPSQWYVMRDNWFDRWVAPQMGRLERFDLFVGWANAALASLRVAHQRGARTVLECGSMHILEQEKVLCEEFEKAGVRAPLITACNKEKMLQEYEETDIIALPSRHVYESFVARGISVHKLLKIPYGVHIRDFSLPRTGVPDKFRLLFVGQVGVQKGIHYLLEAWSKLKFRPNEAELLLVGDLMADGKMLLKPYRLDQTIVVKGPVRHAELAEIYRSASLFVLPSVQDGLAMVIGEAMASGLPVLATKRTGCSEIIQHGVHGLVIDHGNADLIAEKILWCFENRDACLLMGRSAREQIANFTWDTYGSRLMAEYRRIVQDASATKRSSAQQSSI